jgi:hypothetical protein
VSPGNLDLRKKEILNQISKANIDFMDGLYQTLTGLPLWKIYPTAGYKLIAKSHASFHKILFESLDNARKEFKQDADIFKLEHPFMFEIMQNRDLSEQDVTMLAMETFIGGIDAVIFLHSYLRHLNFIHVCFSQIDCHSSNYVPALLSYQPKVPTKSSSRNKRYEQ